MTAPNQATAPDLPAWRIPVAFGVMLALAAALIIVSRSQPEESIVPIAPASASTESADTLAPPSLAAADRLLDDAVTALAAWGLFAATGDLDAVTDTFAAGPQLEQLRAEAVDRAANGPGLPAFEFALSQSEVIMADDQTAVIRSTIEMSRPGTETATFRWDIEMRWDAEEERWLLYTVSTAEG